MVSLQINRQRDNLKIICEANVIRLLNPRNSVDLLKGIHNRHFLHSAIKDRKRGKFYFTIWRYLIFGHAWHNVIIVINVAKFIKLFCPQFKNFRNKLVFVPGKFFQSSLMFEAEAGAYQSETTFKCSTPRSAPCLSHKY